MKQKMVRGLISLSVVGLALTGCGTAPAKDQGNTSGATTAPTAAATSASKGEPTTLVISTWGFSDDFFKKEVYAPFEKAHNAKIVLEIGNNAERLNKVKQGSSSVDLIYLSDYYAQQGIEAGLFDKIDRSRIPNLKDIYDLAKAPLGEDYGPAYTVGRLGIAYNPKATTKEIKSWSDLWSPELSKKLTLPNITATTGPMVLDAASVVAGNTTFNEDQAFAKVKELNKGVVKYYGQTSEFVNMFSQGEIAAGPIMEMYVKDLKAAVPETKFVSPQEGAYAVMNTVNVIKGSKNKQLAEDFINWHLSKEVQEKSAKAKVDSPVNTTLQLSTEEATGITYGADVVSKLRKLDMKIVNQNLKAWIARWNKEVAQ
ncbi:ABC transporter substrate-binding protein [Paenibacillus alginolyticus]|uniref:ABC transporter substrate-binding protein n=1 Tax=Paenibacillus alginolyticus TaxID=59839 RepID=A0ABT4G654_9BACL|nr:ABC transporter substrate-binding protein [Paenibacillus alginolyticus]MCY9668647.1 ABC transporter substrate-binding protein [Paenibacillus alginolyticus]MCY9691663.1 ABC transporter substrate-binding protein [Paenibacillus alginolyticus]MEC0146901.1 ABC transporter substrate-binding protein [Paenibacillus alginolyticus]